MIAPSIPIYSIWFIFYIFTPNMYRVFITCLTFMTCIYPTAVHYKNSGILYGNNLLITNRKFPIFFTFFILHFHLSKAKQCCHFSSDPIL
jgi:hypothetical protein